MAATAPIQHSGISDLAQAWLLAKADEAAANKRRLDIEAQILALTGQKAEGAETHDAEGYKVTVTGKLNRKLDFARWEEIKTRIPANLHPIKLKPELDERGVKWLEANEPTLYAILAQALTITPAKTAISIKEA